MINLFASHSEMNTNHNRYKCQSLLIPSRWIHSIHKMQTSSWMTKTFESQRWTIEIHSVYLETAQTKNRTIYQCFKRKRKITQPIPFWPLKAYHKLLQVSTEDMLWIWTWKYLKIYRRIWKEKKHLFSSLMNKINFKST